MHASNAESLLLAGLDGSPSKTDASAGPQTAEGSGFRPVTGGEQMQSGERLLVEAYAAIWLIVLFFVLLMWRRTRAIESRVESLDLAVSRAAGDERVASTEKKRAASIAKATDEAEASEG